MNAKVEIYTKVYSPHCQRAKDLLHIKGIRFLEYDITDDATMATEMYQRCRHGSVPQIFIDDCPIGGCSELFDLDESGELDRLLRLA